MNVTHLKSTRAVVALLAMACTACAALAADSLPAKPSNRAEAVKIIGDIRRIVAPEGVERLEAIRIGGIDQWVSIRGVDRRNPILLMLHGGPGFVAMPTSWYFARGWEEYFTVVQWDQRGAGKTYLANDPAKIGPTMTLDRMVADTEEMIQWLRKEFGRERIFVAGHSWGSFLGLTVAQRHPEWLHAYIGIAQGTDVPESERRGWQFAMDRARAAGNQTAIRELQSIAPYAQGSGRIPLKDVYLQRKWLGFYGGAMTGYPDASVETALATLSPEYSDEDLSKVWEGNDFSEDRLLAQVLTMDLSRIRKLDCPLILFEGRNDYNVNSQVAAEWFEKVQAPSKTFVWFEHTAHEVMSESPGKTLVSLVKYALPFAEKAGDIAPPYQGPGR